MDEVSYWAKFGGVEHLHDHGRHAAEGGDPLALDQLERALGIEVVHHHDLPAGPDVPHHDGVTARGVEERHREEDTRSAPSLDGVDERRLAEAQRPAGVDEEEVHQVGADVAVRADRALGPPGGARGVEDGGVVVGIDGDVGGRGVGIHVAERQGERPFGRPVRDPSGRLADGGGVPVLRRRCSSATIRAVSSVRPPRKGRIASARCVSTKATFEPESSRP